MKSYNHVTLLGVIKKEPEYNQELKRMILFLEVTRKFKNIEGKAVTDLIEIIVWNKLAELCDDYLEKNSKVLIEGRLEVNKTEFENGNIISQLIVTGENVTFLSPITKGA